MEAVENSIVFLSALNKTKQRRLSSEKAVATKINNMISEMETANIEIVAGKTHREIRNLALDTHGGNYMGDPGPFHFDNQVAINCIRHNLTNYEELWQLCNRGKTGKTPYSILRKRVDDLIRKTYPKYFREGM